MIFSVENFAVEISDFLCGEFRWGSVLQSRRFGYCGTQSKAAERPKKAMWPGKAFSSKGVGSFLSSIL